MIPKILTVGCAYMDMIMRMPQLPAAGETLLAEEGGTSYLPDGHGANCAVGLAKLGAHSVFCCRVGEDIHGQRLHAMYSDYGIETSSIVADLRTPTGLCVVMTEDGKLPRSLLYPGANMNLTRDNLGAAFATNPDALCLQLDLPEETVLDAANRAAERHIPIFLDASPAKRDFPFSRLPQLEIFSPNEQEAEQYTGIRPSGSDACLKAMLELAKMVKSRYYVIKMADRGAFIFDGRHFNMISPYIVKVLDSAGAGDAFMAALTLSYLQNHGDIAAACKYANTVGAITVMRAGTFDSMPTADEVAAFIARNGNR